MKKGMRKAAVMTMAIMLALSLAGGALAAPLFTSKGFRLPVIKYRPTATPEPTQAPTLEPTVEPDSETATGSVAAFVVLGEDADALNVRASADAGAESVAKLNHGDAVTILTRDGDWSMIRTADGKEGYVLSKFLSTTSPIVTIEPTEEPVAEPTEEPAVEPTEEPVAEPTEEPAAEPTEEPVAEPTEEPVAEPTAAPTEKVILSEPTPQPTIMPARDHVIEEDVAVEEGATVVARGDADVRVSNDGLSEIFTTLSDGTQLNVLAVEGDWVKVEVDGQIGYIYKDGVAGIVFETPELPEDERPAPKVTIFSSRRTAMELGEPVYLTSKLENFEGYEVRYQWQCDRGAGFEDIEGANSDSYSYAASVETFGYDWKLVVYYRPVQ